MAKHAQKVMKANDVSHIVTVIQSAVEDVVLPIEEDMLEPESINGDDNLTADGDPSLRVVDIIVSEWMGYFLLRESMLDTVIRGRDKFLKRRTGLMFPSHADMFLAPIDDEEERKRSMNEYSNAMADFQEFAKTTSHVYGVEMKVLQPAFDKEQRDYFLLSSRWAELHPDSILADPKLIRHYDLMTCTLEDARGIPVGYLDAEFDFDIDGSRITQPISGLAGWFTVDFRTRTDSVGQIHAPCIRHPVTLSTGPENG
jgi:type I protein arginine methyltransferase